GSHRQHQHRGRAAAARGGGGLCGVEERARDVHPDCCARGGAVRDYLQCGGPLPDQDEADRGSARPEDPGHHRPAGGPPLGSAGRCRQRDRILPAAGELDDHRPSGLPGGCQLMLDWLLEKMAEAAGKTAIANGPAVCTYRELLARVADWQQKLAERGIAGKVVSIEAEYGAEAVAVFLAATSARNILVPISAASAAHRDDFLEIAEVEFRLRPDDADDKIIATG